MNSAQASIPGVSVASLQKADEGTGCLGSRRCVFKHGTVGCNPQQGAGMVQHAIAQGILDHVACQQAQYANTAGHSKLWNCITGSNMSTCPLAEEGSLVHAGIIAFHTCVPPSAADLLGPAASVITACR